VAAVAGMNLNHFGAKVCKKCRERKRTKNGHQSKDGRTFICADCCAKSYAKAWEPAMKV
jgi:superfamily II helicase